MKVTFEMPREAEGKVRFFDKEGEVVVEPRFRRSDAVQPISYLIVAGHSGTERRFVLSVSGTTGLVTVQEVKDATPVFDRPKSDKPNDTAESLPDDTPREEEG